MNESLISYKNATIVYDNTLIAQPSLALFDPTHYSEHDSNSAGRGSVLFIPGQTLMSGQKNTWVLKQYLRGGMVRHLSHTHYFYTGLNHTRMVAEFRLLQQMHRWQLPVPRPVAALVLRSGCLYSGSLITEKINALGTLGEICAAMKIPEQQWQAIGTCVARFHARNICHADLNANNIMLAEDGVFLIDFDKGKTKNESQQQNEQQNQQKWQADNLARLRRSLEKIKAEGCPHDPLLYWDSLVASYIEAIAA